MRTRSRILLSVLLLAMLSLAGAVSAQDIPTLSPGQPIITALDGSASLLVSYRLTEARAVTLQVVSDSAAPRLSVLLNDEAVASAENPGQALVVTLNAFLMPGDYQIRVGSVNGLSGTISLTVLAETPITVNLLPPGVPLSGEVSAALPAALYRLDALPEPAYLYIENALSASAVSVRLVNAETGTVNGVVSSDLLGARLRLPAGTTAYQLEVLQSGAPTPESYSLCYAPVSADTCAGTPAAQAAATALPPGVCAVTPNAAGGVNIRQTADINAPVVGALPAGASATVLGSAPGGTFYNISVNALNGWVAASVVTLSGNCGGLPTINPPPIAATAVPAAPTLPPTPTIIPMMASPTPSGPCLVTLTAPTNVYSTTSTQIDNLFDQVQSGELIPVGRTADGAWWRTNYANAWLPTSALGVTAVASGNCAGLPIVSP